MHVPETITIAVTPAGAYAARPRLFAALEQAFAVRFTVEPIPDAAGTIVIAADPGRWTAAAGGMPALVVADEPTAESPVAPVRLADTVALDRRVRGITLHDRPAGSALSPSGEVLAASAEAVWRRDAGAAPVDRVRSVLPELAEGQVLYGLLSQRPIAALALIEFLRARTVDCGWRPPPLRAAFVFDDPNLRWRSYGYIDYPELVAHADAHGYHAVMAMIPLDAARPHRPTVSLFARRPDRLSLVFHGNDHVRGELLAPGDDATALALAAQAIRRIERFERRHGLRVDRVMMPPHGLCSRHTALALSAVGFDALCAIHPAPWTEERPASPPLVAWNPAGFVGGCAVIPRDALCSTVADLALRAYLDHPLVVYGHHDDVADGLEPLADAAALVNRFGDVRWTSIGEIACTNHFHRIVDGRMIVRPFSRRVRVDVPEGIYGVMIEAPRSLDGAVALRGWSVGTGPVQPFDAPVPLTAGSHVIRLRAVEEIDPRAVPAPGWSPWPRVRRAVTEVRDRAAPLRRRAA